VLIDTEIRDQLLQFAVLVLELNQVETGTPVAEVIRRMRVSEQTFYLYGRLSLCKTG
jgi:hypothetical protein